MLKQIPHVPCKQSGTIGKVKGAMPKWLQAIMVEMDCDVVHCPTVGNKHWMFDPQLVDVVNHFPHFPIWQY